MGRSTNNDTFIDIAVYDLDRDDDWDISYHDVDHDGNPDLVGYHPDGNVLPSRFEVYDPIG